MTTEDQLRHIIEAQVKGGCTSFRFVSEHYLDFDWKSRIGGTGEPTSPDTVAHILEILLDPAGLRAAYEMLGIGFHNGRPVLAKIAVAHDILDTWLSSEGDAAKTIQTAYDLLP